MSTVKTNDLQTTTGGIPTVKGQKLIPTAWVNFNGTSTVAIRDSENVSSITDRAVGKYTINFTNNLANTNYAIVCSCTIGGAANYNRIAGASSNDVSWAYLNTFNDGGFLYDVDYINAAVLGGQA